MCTMGVTSFTLEITVISCENVHVKEDAYVVVRGESLNCYTTKMVKNKDCENNSSFLSWNEKFLLDMPLHARSIKFEVQCKKFKGFRPIGVARIEVSDILGEVVPENGLKVLSYRLRDWEGRQNGIIHFSVSSVVPEKFPIIATEKEMVVGAKNSDDQIIGMDVGAK
ncbi:BON1-associated protein 2-like [Cicer arietinum]|uniref:BON1-associated protein 2-like n=1 Tax=Cicer arietinum TaxID=3827 RepID=A0A1S2YW38_CICAR|nr:BON1-associated protein 2-like [Cicer arietinum]